MIVDNPQSFFIYVFHPDSLSDSGSYIACKGQRLTNKEYLEHWGKWIIMDKRQRLDELAAKLNPYVERKEIPCIKYDRFPTPMFELGMCVMCVFCDDREREEVWQVLAKYGVSMKVWIYDRLTEEMWMPGGMLLERWISSHGLEGEEAEEIKEEARRKFEQAYGKEDELCSGWKQLYLRDG